VHKGSTQTNKKIKVRVQKERSKETQVCPGLAHRTVSGAPGPYTSELFTFRFLQRRSAIIHWTVRCTSGATTLRRNGRVHSAPDSATVRGRSQSRGQRCTGLGTVPVRCGTGLSSATRSQRSNDQLRQNPNCWVTWLAHRTVSGDAPDCPVRPSTAATPNGCFGG
jgi:hypothetical protein